MQVVRIEREGVTLENKSIALKRKRNGYGFIT